MTQLAKAMEAANERKSAAFADESPQGITLADTELQDRAIFSGFDIGYDELVGTSTHVAELYSRAAHDIGLRSLFTSAWCDGLLTGLLLASLPPTSDPGDTEVTGPEEGGVLGRDLPNTDRLALLAAEYAYGDIPEQHGRMRPMAAVQRAKKELGLE